MTQYLCEVHKTYLIPRKVFVPEPKVQGNRRRTFENVFGSEGYIYILLKTDTCSTATLPVSKLKYLSPARIHMYLFIRECSFCFAFEWRAVWVIAFKIGKSSKQKYTTCTFILIQLGKQEERNDEKKAFTAPVRTLRTHQKVIRLLAMRSILVVASTALILYLPACKANDKWISIYDVAV